MTSPIFLHELPIEQLKKLSEGDIYQIQKAEKLYWKNKPCTKYAVVVNGAKTRDGGLVRATSGCKIYDLSVALVGDEAIYADGSTAKIITGCGSVLKIEKVSAAMVGSQLENGDEIIDSPNTSLVFCLYHDVPRPIGFLSNVKE